MGESPYSQNCEDDLIYTNPDCDVVSSGIRKLSLVSCDAIEQIRANFSDADLWTQLITAGEIVPPFEVRGDKPKGTTVQLDGFGDQKFRNVGRDYVLNLQAQYDSVNFDFFNDSNKSNSYYGVYLTGDAGKRVAFITADIVTFDSDDVIGTEKNGEVIYDFVLTWDSPELNQPYTSLPPGIF